MLRTNAHSLYTAVSGALRDRELDLVHVMTAIQLRIDVCLIAI